MEAKSHSALVGEIADHMLQAFKNNSLKSGSVLTYQDMYAYLNDHADHYKDVQREAEQHLSKEGFVNPAPEGLRLTDFGAKKLYGDKN